uniref:Reverse transcriptase domain-containing protein n=1 Tax=Leptobrachium leishanense TaxID=445787 RepID=A0A8C5QA48_9ANUR
MGNWRLNDSLIVQGSDVSDTSAVLREYFALNVTDDVTISSAWLAHKAVVRGHLIQRGATRKKAFNAQMTSVQRQISDLESQHKSNPTPDLLSRLTTLRRDLIQMTLQSSERAIRRLNLTQYTQGNKAGRLLASKLKSKRLQTKIPYLLDNGGDRIYNPLKISEEFANFYASLYNLKSDPTTHDPDPDEINQFLQDAELPSLSHSQAADLLVPFTEEEVRKAVKALPKNKAPGPDGFSNLYYQTFADILIPTLTKLFNHIKSTGVIPPEMLQATIVTLPKPGKPPTSCANFRPISLLNVDAKLYAKLLASRMAPLLPLLISAEQTGFVAGRQTCDNTRRFYNIIDIAYRTNTTGLLLALDAEKAFDRLHWGYMRKALEVFGFPALFINSIMSLYSLPTAKVLASGFLSSSFSITNGTRQGCPLSPLIFVLALEPLASRIRRDASISGISTPDGIHKLAMFADDILIFLTSPETSLPSLMHQLTAYGLVSYYKNNVSKTQALPLHVDDFSLSTLSAMYPFDWRTTSLKYLGISLTKSRGTILKLNYNPLMASISSQLNSWHALEVSWMGRMAALKMCILPQILYFFRNIPVFIPAHMLLRMQKMLQAHIWKGRPPRIPASTINTTRRRGGLGFINITAYYRAALLAQLLSSMSQRETPLWLRMENAYTAPFRIHDLMWFETLPHHTLEGILPSTSLSLMSWRLWGRRLLRPFSLLSLAPLRFLCRIIQDLNLDRWFQLGLTHIHQLFTASSIKTFPDLTREFALPASECFKYLRVKHALTQRGISSFAATDITAFHRLCLGKKVLKKPLSLCYDSLLSANPNKKLPYMIRWDKDLSFESSKEDWFYATETVYKYTRSTNLRESHLKLLYRWYLTPNRVAHISGQPNVCWRCGTSGGSILHIFWQCPLLATLWGKVCRLISHCTGISMPLCPRQYLLHMLPITIQQRHRGIISIILSVAKTVIARHWLSQASPSMREVMLSLENVYMYEEMYHKAANSLSVFQGIWEGWERFVTSGNLI